jgi:hypothetical protein
MTFDLYVIVTNGAEDQIIRKRHRTQGQEQNCKESISCKHIDPMLLRHLVSNNFSISRTVTKILCSAYTQTVCGILDELYPDKRAMGFPFDRYPRPSGTNQQMTLDGFVQNVPNSKYTQVSQLFSEIFRRVTPLENPRDL